VEATTHQKNIGAERYKHPPRTPQESQNTKKTYHLWCV